MAAAKPLVLMLAGGTGGHVYPALAVALELLSRGYRVEWIGTERGLEHRVVPAAELRAETERWCAELLEKSPTALQLAKVSFNADTAHVDGITELGYSALQLYYGTPEAREGREAFVEKRKPSFRKPGGS